MKFLIGNWKSNMTLAESTEWFESFASFIQKQPLPESLTVVLCVPFTLLAACKELIATHQLSIAIGAQDVSPFGKGPYTGEISADMIREFASYVLIGHSERRQYFQESDEEVSFELLQAHTAGLSTVYCVPNSEEQLFASTDIIAYEPISAIGTGISEDPKEIRVVCQKIKDTMHVPVLYGGSVTEENSAALLDTQVIDGFLVGGTSLDAEKFYQIGKTFIPYT